MLKGRGFLLLAQCIQPLNRDACQHEVAGRSPKSPGANQREENMGTGLWMYQRVNLRTDPSLCSGQALKVYPYTETYAGWACYFS